MGLRDLFEAAVQFVPGLDIVYHLSKTPKGMSQHEYAGFATTATECRNTPAVGIARCKKQIATQALVWIKDWIGIPIVADILKVLAAGIAGQLGQPQLAAALAIAGVGDACIVAYKAFEIGAAARAAKTTYCVCGWQGPAAPSTPSGE